MNTIIKKCFAVVMILAWMIAMVGCGADAPEKEETDEQGTGGQASSDATSDDKETITVALQTYSYITDYEQNYLTQKLEEKLGVNIEFHLLSADSSEALTQLSLLFMSNEDVPDVVCTGALSQEAILNYGMNGFFLPLNDYLGDESKTPYFNSIASEEDKAAMLSASTSADGNIYGLPTFEPESWNLTPFRQYINEVWLQNLGLDMPTNVDEFHDVLTAFKEQDPNGNGLQDEIPLFGIAAGTYGENVTIPLMNAFIYYPASTIQGAVLSLADDGKTVIAPFAQDAWRDGLEYMHQLSEEGLMPASVFTDDKTQFMAVLNNEDANLVGALSSGSLSRWNDFDNNENGQEYTMMPPLTGPSGTAYSPYLPYAAKQIWFVTSAAKNPELAVALGDYFYDETISTVVRYGEEDVDWTKDASLISDSNYSKAILNDIWGENNNTFWRNINPRYVPLDDFNTWLPANPNFEAKSNIFRYEMNPAYNYSAHPDKVLENVKYTNEEAQEQAEIIVNISSYVSENLAQFVTGARPLSDWDNYVKELDNMGLQTWIDNTQTAFDRQ